MIYRTVNLTQPQADAACSALATAIVATHIDDANTWHGGLGYDGCEHCQALVNIRAATSRPILDHLRP